MPGVPHSKRSCEIPHFQQELHLHENTLVSIISSITNGIPGLWLCLVPVYPYCSLVFRPFHVIIEGIFCWGKCTTWFVSLNILAGSLHFPSYSLRRSCSKQQSNHLATLMNFPICKCKEGKSETSCEH